MLMWIEDINCPGAEIIFDRLIKFTDTKLLAYAVSSSVKKALVCDQQVWLSSMSALLENENLKAELPKDILRVLKNRYHKG